MNKYHIYNSAMTIGNDNILVTIHNAGLFSCHTIALTDLMVYYNTYQSLPTVFDRTAQYLYYRNKPIDNLLPMLFAEAPSPLAEYTRRDITHANAEPQFSDYKVLLHDQMKPFIDRYFMPSEMVMNRVKEFEERYQIDYENTIGIFHRDNDKHRETKIATSDSYLNKAKEINSGRLKYFVLPDNYEFLFEAKRQLGEAIHIEENACMPYNKDKCTFMVVPYEEKPNHALNFFASVIIMSRCKHLVLHSGNGAFWTTIYRGNSDNIHQYLNGSWV